ncbi:MAG TPA: hypothetical protein VEA35_08500 [Ramlibacter sp.]|nr:hypothetical protein [Ramlibacter sp.]
MNPAHQAAAEAADADEEQEISEQPMRPTPDEAGPHDVPDEQVIEKTLPTTTPAA